MSFIFLCYSENDRENIHAEQDHQTILNTLLDNPEEFNLKHKPSGIRDDQMFTLDMREVSIASAKADDNGVYISKGKAKKFFDTLIKALVLLTKMRIWSFTNGWKDKKTLFFQDMEMLPSHKAVNIFEKIPLCSRKLTLLLL